MSAKPDEVEESSEYTESSSEESTEYSEDKGVSKIDIKPNMQDLSFDTSKTPRSISYDDESNIHDDITLTFLFPDGKEQDVTCKTGETVSNLKKKLLDEYQIPFSCKLTYKSTTMLDPLSLNDFPELLKGAKEGKPVIEISV